MINDNCLPAKVENVLNGEERALEREAKKGMGQDEATFSVESALDQTYEWSDKYRPRKPRYRQGNPDIDKKNPGIDKETLV